MKNKKIIEAFEKSNPSEELKKEMIENILKQSQFAPEERKSTMKKFVIAASISILALSTSIGGVAAYRWLTSKQVAEKLGDESLAKHFGKVESEVQTAVYGDYEVAYIGSVSGKNISDRFGSASERHPDRTYAIMAISNTSGADMTYEEGILVTPFIQGLKPWQYNIFTMGGSASSIIVDGILYWMMECDSIEIFADREVYLAVMNSMSIAEAYHYDEETGIITRKEDYDGMNLLFKMDLDSSKADSEVAQKYIKEVIEEQKTQGSDQGKQENKKTDNMVSVEDTVYYDEKLGLEITMPFYNEFSSYSGDDKKARSMYGFYCNVEGENIDSITYTLDKGKFYKKEEVSQDELHEKSKDSNFWGSVNKECIVSADEHKQQEKECKFIGNPEKGSWCYNYDEQYNSYTVKYEEQSDLDHQYAIEVEAEYNGVSNKTADLVQLVHEQLEQTKITIDIKYKDGRTEQKYIKFKNTRKGDIEDVGANNYIIRIIE